EIIKNTPKCYIDLMEKCWDSDPSKRPTIGDLEHIISQWLRCVNKYYVLNEENDREFSYSTDITQFKGDIDEFVKADKCSSSNINQFKNDIDEFVKTDKALLQEQTDTS